MGVYPIAYLGALELFFGEQRLVGNNEMCLSWHRKDISGSTVEQIRGNEVSK